MTGNTFNNELAILKSEKWRTTFVSSVMGLIGVYALFKADSLIPGVMFIVSSPGFYLWYQRLVTVKKQALENHIQSLESKDFSNALHYGRIYYSLKNKGFMGIHGDCTTFEDEQIISNNINAFK